MNEKLFSELPAWLTQAGLAGAPETYIVSGFCDRCVTAGIPLGRAHLFIDTLHPVHEGSLFRWGVVPTNRDSFFRAKSSKLGETLEILSAKGAGFRQS